MIVADEIDERDDTGGQLPGYTPVPISNPRPLAISAKHPSAVR